MRTCNNPWIMTRNWSGGCRRCRKMVDYPSGVRRRRHLRHFLNTPRQRQLLMAPEHSNLSLALWRRMIKARVVASALLCDAVMSPVGCMWSLVAFVDILRSLFFLFWFCDFYAHTRSTLYDPSVPPTPTYTFYPHPDPHTPRIFLDLAVFVGCIFFLVARDIVGIHSFFRT